MDAIIFFDIRNFSGHRQFLARKSAAHPLSKLITQLLEQAVSVSTSYVQTYGVAKFPLLNHTGDGFALVLQNGRSCLAALDFASLFREFAEQKLAVYQHEFETLQKKLKFKVPPPKSLHYGMGIHCGPVTALKYKGFGGTRRAFLGSAVNIASRVEGCTKDHPHPVICTERVLKQARRELGSVPGSFSKKYFMSLGLHNLRGLEGTFELITCEPGLHHFLAARGVPRK